jgi:hypothetical protein
MKTTRFPVLLPLLTAGACATAPSAPPDIQLGGSGPTRYKVTVVSASIASATPDGQPWHSEKPSNLLPLFKSLATLSRIPFASEAVAALVAPETGADVPPIPLVEVRVGGEMLGSSISRPTLTPKWNWSFALDTRDYKYDSQISFVVRDGDGEKLLAKYETSIGEILVKPDHQLPAADSVEILQIKVEPLPSSPEYRVFHFKVPANESLMDMASRPRPQSDNGWQPIPVLNGDAIRIGATGAVTFSSGVPAFKDTVSPEGRTSVERGSSSHPLEQCEKMPDHALVAFLAGKPIFIGTKHENSKVPESGQLLLGVNDIDVGDSSGYFEVTVEVNPPDLIAQRRPAPAFQAPSWKR